MTRLSLVVGIVAVLGSSAVARPEDPASSAIPSVPDVVTADAFDPTGWTKLGEIVLQGQDRSALVTLSPTKANIDQLTFVVAGNLDLSSVTVVTAGNKRIVRGAQHHFWASSPTKQIELTGNKRALRSLAVKYALAKAARATLIVYGRDSTSSPAATTAIKSDEAPSETVHLGSETRSTGPAINARSGWTLIGTKSVDGKNDTDAIGVTRDDSALFSQLAIVVTGGDLELKDMRLRFAGGQSADIDTRYYFRGESRSRVLSLPGGKTGTVVRTVQLRYGADRGNGKTRVQVWAR
jgi:hypothetical protein